MDSLIAITELTQAFETFKENHEQKFQDLERSVSKQNRFDTTLHKQEGHGATLKAFQAYLRKGDDRQLQALTQKALSTRDQEGGYLIPQTIEARLNQHVQDYCPMRRLSTVTTISTTALELLVDQKEPNAGWAQEVGAREVTDSPELRKIRIVAHELYAKPRATERLLSDAPSSLEEWLTQAVAKKMAKVENQAFIYGDGDNKPKGFLNYESCLAVDWEWGKLEHMLTGVDNAFNPDTGVDKLLELIGSLKTIYLKEAVWVMSRPAFVAIQKLKDGEGKFLIYPSHMHEQRPTLLGYPVEIIEDMPGFDLDAHCRLAFGNFKEAYQIVEHAGTQILRDPYSAKPFVEFYTTRRVGGDVVNFEALKILKFSAA